MEHAPGHARFSSEGRQFAAVLLNRCLSGFNVIDFQI